MYQGKLIITLKKIIGSNIFVDPKTSDQLSNNEFNAFHISDIHKTFLQTAWPPQRKRRSSRAVIHSCWSALFLPQTTRTLVWEAVSCQTVLTPSSLSHSFLYSPSTSNSQQEFYKKYETAPNSPRNVIYVLRNM